MFKKFFKPIPFSLLVLPLIVMRQWFLPGLPQTHDAEVHISRAAAYAVSISEGNILPRWAGYFNWGYGTPSLMFLYPGLPYVSALVHLASGMTFIDIYKLWMILGYIGSGFLWFLWMRKLGMRKRAAFVGTLFYLLAPYRLVNVFVRGALAEHLGFFFFPLLMVAFTNLLTDKRPTFHVAPALAIAGVILTHNLSALLYLPIVMIYPFFFKKFSSKDTLFSPRLFVNYYGAIAFGFFLTTFFWLPALLEAKYTLASWLFSVADWYADHFLAFRQLVWSSWEYGFSLPGINHDGMSFQVGIAYWIVLGLSAVFLLGRGKLAMSQVQKKNRWLLATGVILVVVGMFFTLPISNRVWKLISILPKFQFPWRFLSYVVIGTSIASGAVASCIHKRTMLVLFGLLPLLFSFPYWKTAGPSTLTEQFLTVDYVGTSDTGETTPVWAVRFQEHKAKAPVEVVSADGQVEIGEFKKLQQRHVFQVHSTGNARIADNTLYFPGWTVYVDRLKIPIEYQDENWRGIITFPVERGDHSVEVVFEETLLRKIADSVSLIAISLLVVSLVRRVPARKLL